MRHQSKFFHSHSFRPPRLYHSERPYTKPLNIQTPPYSSLIVSHPKPLPELHPSLEPKEPSYKSVRFAKEASPPHSLDYSLSHYSSFLTNKPDSESGQKSVLSRKQMKKIRRVSRSRSKDPNLPHEYYPQIVSPLRHQFNHPFPPKGKDDKQMSKRKKSTAKKRVKSRRSSRRDSRSTARYRTKSRSMSAKRKLDYKELDNDKHNQTLLASTSILDEDYELLSKSDERELAFFLREIQMLEHKLEIAKVVLADQPDFNLLDAFAIFDKTGNGWVHYFDIIDELKKLSMLISSEEGRLFMTRYDRDKDQRLDFAEF